MKTYLQNILVFIINSAFIFLPIYCPRSRITNSKSLTIFFPTRVQLTLQLINLLSIFLDKRLLDKLLVNLRLITDGLGLVGIVQSAQRLLQIAQRRTNGRDQRGLGATTQRVLQQARQVALPVRNVVAMLDQRRDHTTQRGQRLVDAASLSGSLASRAGPLDILTASQVDQVELAHLGI